MPTLVDIVFEENPGRRRQELLRRIEEEVRLAKDVWGRDFCVLSLATNIHVYSPAAFLSYHVIGHVEEHLVKFRQEGCKGVLVLLSTYGGEVTFPEAFISKLRGMGFEKVHTFVLDAAFSAGTLLALLSDKIVGFSSSHLGPVDPQLIVATPQGLVRVVGAMSVKRLIEELLPKLASDKGLGKEGLARLYAAQDLYLYEKALESIGYIERVFSEEVCKGVEGCEELKRLLLHEATEHSQPIPLQRLASMLPGKVLLIDQSPQFQKLAELVVSYRALLRYLFMFESRPGAAPGSVRVFVVGSKHGEIVGEVSPLPVQAPAQRAPPLQQEKPPESR
jgi:hypothetical protein